MGTDPEDLDDALLLLGCRARPELFAVFYRRHVANVLAYFARRCRSSEVALDLTAETFAGALESAHRYRRGPAPAEAWLYAIARNKFARAVRLGASEDRARRRLEMEPIVLDDDGISQINRRIEAADLDVMRRLAELPADQRRAIEAHVLEDLAYDEVAAELGCSPSVVRQRVSRGLRTLRAQAQKGAIDV